MQIRLRQRPGGVGIERQDGRERRGSRRALFHRERVRRSNGDRRGVLVQADANRRLGGRRLCGNDEEESAESEVTHILMVLGERCGTDERPTAHAQLRFEAGQEDAAVQGAGTIRFKL